MTIKSTVPTTWFKKYNWWDNAAKKNEGSLIARDFGRDVEDVFSNFLQRFNFNDNLTSLIHNSDAIISPRLNLSETDKDFLIEAEMPGIEEKNVDMSISDDKILSLKGKRESFKENDSSNYHLRESFFGSFERELYLPDNCDIKNVKASMKNGVLKINIPKTKTAPSQIRKIELSK